MIIWTEIFNYDVWDLVIKYIHVSYDIEAIGLHKSFQ